MKDLEREGINFTKLLQKKGKHYNVHLIQVGKRMLHTSSLLQKIVYFTLVPRCKKGVHYNSTLQKCIRYNLDAKKRVYITPDPCFRSRLQSVV